MFALLVSSIPPQMAAGELDELCAFTLDLRDFIDTDAGSGTS